MSYVTLEEKKKSLLAVSRQMQQEGLVVGPGGNTSLKDAEGVMWISPSGIPFLEMSPSDFVPVDVASGKLLDTRRMPSSEVPLHLDIYRRRPDIECIVHAHPPYVIALSSVDIAIEPMFPDYVVFLGKRVPQVPYTTPCTEEMGDLVARGLGDEASCVIKNHGAVTVGASVKEAFTRMQVLEAAAQILFHARLLGTPTILPPTECDAILNLDIEQYRKKLLREHE